MSWRPGNGSRVNPTSAAATEKSRSLPGLVVAA